MLCMVGIHIDVRAIVDGTVDMDRYGMLTPSFVVEKPCDTQTNPHLHNHDRIMHVH